MNATRLYQAGAEREEAVRLGCAAEFDRLVLRYRDESIPLGELLGFTPTPPYSCEYHTGPKARLFLRIKAEQCSSQ